MMTPPRAAVWVCAVLLAATFTLAGISKLAGPSAPRWSERFQRWGYPANTQYVIGALEILGGVGVLIPAWRRPAAATLVALMTGALGTHAVNGEFPRVIPPLVLGGLALLIYAARPRRERTPNRGNGV